ncbi:MAG: Fe(3+) ABC transporter substrate-binding protein [Chloroflexota bacterium]
MHIRGLGPSIAAIFAAVIIGLVVSVPSPSVTRAAPIQQGNVVNVYSARHYDTDDALFDGFTQQTGITVNVIRGSEDELLERLKAEGANSPADVLITVDAGRLWKAQEAGLFQPTVSQILNERIPENLREPEGHWFGFSMRARIIAYAKDRVDPSQLSTYEDLADPKWQGKVVIRSSTHPYNQSLVGSLIEANGLDATEEWARGVVTNMARTPKGGDTDQLLAVASGEADLAVSNTYYVARLRSSTNPEQKAAGDALGVFFPNQGPGERGAHVNVSGGGVTAHAPNHENAVAFLEYLTGEEAQQSLANASFEFPVVAGVPVHPILAEMGEFRRDTLNAKTFGANNQLALLIMNRAGWR